MQIYRDKCPFCGTHISIENAVICPGCTLPIYYGPGIKDFSGNFYYTNKRERDAVIANKIASEIAVKEYWESEEGKKRAARELADLQEECRKNNRAETVKRIILHIVLYIFFLIPIAGFVWMFLGGYEWDNFFEKFGLRALIVGIPIIWLCIKYRIFD